MTKDFSKKIKIISKEYGFDYCGIAKAEKLGVPIISEDEFLQMIVY